MLQNLTGWHALVILAIVLLVFGSAKLPALARSVGQSVKILKDEVHNEPRAVTASASGVIPASDSGSTANLTDAVAVTEPSIDTARRAS